MLSRRLGVRTRILAIALVPSLALVLIGVGAAGTLIDHSNNARTWADELQSGVAPTRELIEAVQLERQLTEWRTAGAEIDVRDLATARLRLDNALRQIAPAQSRLSSIGPQAMGDTTAAMGDLGGKLTQIRAGADATTLSTADADAFYSAMPQLVLAGVQIAQKQAPDAPTAIELAQAGAVLQGLEAMSRATALGAALIDGGPGLSADLAGEYVRLLGYYRTRIESLLTDTDSEQAAAAKTLTSGAAWQQLGAMETVLAQRALPRTAGAAAPRTVLPLTTDDWQAKAGEVDHALAELWQSENLRAQHLASTAAARTTRNSLLAGAGMLVVALGAILVALALANRIIRRLRRLRDETFALADEHLPETMRRLAAGEQVDIETEAPALKFGSDEIGQVAEAFGHAHAAAVAAAITESRTREGVKAVFLNIAHRSQVVVHRQLELLDEAESTQENPAVLEIFFRLDHLATRERRNAENLVILAGGQPGRQWRNPVPLMELVRSAVGETVDYKRVRTGRLPQAFIVGGAVGDLIHLLAELIDNATSFSPPQAHVQVAGSTVARGVALEISDQGMGIPEAELHRINAMLATPADFGITSFSSDSRLGLFVVSQLAGRHGISVRLSESDYGGIRAIVLVPAALVAGETPSPEYTSGQLPLPRRAEYNPPTADLPALRSAPRAPAPQTRPPMTGGLPPARPYDTGRETQPEADVPENGDRPSLPRRRRQASLAPELAQAPAPPEPEAESVRTDRSAEQARDLMSAIENGTRQGRRIDPRTQPKPTTYRQEGDGEHLPRR
ncbi:MAG: hypothetical protein JWN03_7172 [Nocardia sp.]|uniref:sensor histidine kinase n=1 Tax=Nocardia sp. TaxID=1821 RepID=UPI00260B1D31|nr:nitrate- and nitrite sensing domain-containing protein [Nocardia sp.]MCU1646897.1 hypothetical protein [Nocardia sp.]